MRCRASGAYDCDGHPGCGVIEAPPGSNQAHASPGTSVTRPRHTTPPGAVRVPERHAGAAAPAPWDGVLGYAARGNPAQRRDGPRGARAAPRRLCAGQGVRGRRLCDDRRPSLLSLLTHSPLLSPTPLSLPASPTGRSDVVVWRIHQKTQPMGGETRHGWPDATYLDRLRSECATAAVVPP